MNVVISSRESLQGQMSQTMRFLKRNGRALMRLRQTDGVESICLDFGVARSNAEAGEYYRFPSELVERAAAAGMSLEISRYAGRKP